MIDIGEAMVGVGTEKAEDRVIGTEGRAEGSAALAVDEGDNDVTPLLAILRNRIMAGSRPLLLFLPFGDSI